MQKLVWMVGSSKKNGKIGKGVARGASMKLQEIKHAITELNPKELARFRQWFEEFGEDAKSTELDNIDKALLRKRVEELRGSLKGSGAMKALMEERRKG